MLIFKRIVFCQSLLLLLFAHQLKAQETPVNIKVINARSGPVPFVTLKAFPATDSSQSIQKATDSSGWVVFHLQQNIHYIIRVTSSNFQPVEKRITVKGTKPIFEITVEDAAKTLSNVVVTASKPLMRQEDDKTIVDPENLAAASTNAYEIMEKIPGMFVDQDGNIYLNSTTPATIYINGRDQKMSTADMATLLKSLPPNSIASIEILRTPSARYDASGSGGIVNVILKKGVRIGLTGSVNAGFNQGNYGNRFIGLNLNNSDGKLSTYINLQYSRRNTFEEIKTDRIFATDSLLSQDAFTRYAANTYYFGYGLGYQLNKKWDVGYDGRITLNSSKNRSTNQSEIKEISTNNPETNNEARVQNKGNDYNLTQSVSAKYKVDTSGSEWSSDFSFTYSPNNTDQHFITTLFFPFSAQSDNSGRIENRLRFFTLQTNFIKKFSKQFIVETGIKTTNVLFKNNTQYFRTNAYHYNENINAAYLQASKNIFGITLKAGTRLENTNMMGKQLQPNDTSFTIHRTDLFPYVYLSKSFMKVANYDVRAYLVFRRTIIRPAYEYLNPSPRTVDQYLQETGNPSLRPQFTKNYEANISANEHPILAIGVNDTKDIFTQVVYQADTSRRLAYRTYDNLGTNKEMYFRALAAIPPGKKYFFVVGLQYNHNFYQGFYEKRPLSFKRGSYTIFTYQTLRFKPNTQFTLSGFARFKGQLQFYELSSFGSLNMSVAQQFLKKKLTATLSANDIFLTNRNEFTLQQGTVNASGLRRGDTRRFGLNIRYNFGFRKKEETNNLFNVESPEK
jgi:hypothetical protein